MQFNYDAEKFRGDLFGGLTAGIVALPLALAFGVTSGLPHEVAAVAGVYGAIAVGILAAVFGGTPVQISGPTGPMTVVAAAVIGAAAQHGAEIDLSFVFGTFALAGVFQLVLAAVRAGSFVRFIPYPVVSGFMTGIGVIIILLQVFPTVGLDSPTSPLQVVLRVPEAFGSNTNLMAVGVTAATIAIIFGMPKLTKKVPGTLVALVVMTGAVWGLSIPVPLLGEIPTGLPGLHLSLPTIEVFFEMIPPAISLAALGAIDSLLTSIVADNVTRTRHEPNRELFGQGIGNIVAGIIGGLPGAGATMRTMVNVQSGGKTRVSGVVHGVFLITVLLGFGQVAGQIPVSVLAGILIMVGVGIMDYRGLKTLMRVPRADAGVMLLVLSLTVFVDLLWAVAAGVTVASMVFIRNMAALAEERSDVFGLDDDGAWADEGGISAGLRKKIYIKHLDGPMFFGFATQMTDLVGRLPDVEMVVIRMDRVPYIDHSGLVGLEDSISRLTETEVDVLITGLSEQPAGLLRTLRIIGGLVPESQIFANFQQARDWMVAHLREEGSVKALLAQGTTGV